MVKICCCVTYNGIGIYETLKSKIWDNNSNFTKEDWGNFKKLENVNWLKVLNKKENIFMERIYVLCCNIKWK